MEEIVFIPGYDNKYTIDTKGTIISYCKKKPIIRKPHINTSGYLHVRLICNGKDHSVSIHVLLAKAFIPNPENLPTVNHKDGNKLNNRLNNLEWASHSDQQKHAYQNKLRLPSTGEKNCKAKLPDTLVKEIITSKEKRRTLSDKYGVSLSTIDSIKRRTTWKHVLQ